MNAHSAALNAWPAFISPAAPASSRFSQSTSSAVMTKASNAPDGGCTNTFIARSNCGACNVV